MPPLNIWGCNQQLAYPYWSCSRACNFGSSVQASLIAAKKPGPPECWDICEDIFGIYGDYFCGGIYENESEDIEEYI